MPYGSSADWADSYFSRDLLTGPLTGGGLPYAHAVDVTSATDELVERPIYCNPLSLIPCGVYNVPKTRPSHGYPIEFYLKSIQGKLLACAGEYGFPLSKEAGGWEKRSDYPPGKEPVQLCPVTPLPEVASGLTLARSGALNFSLLSTAGDLSRLQLAGVGGFSLSSTAIQPRAGQHGGGGAGGPPAWFAVAVEVTNRVNFVEFQAAFTSVQPAEGLLTVYWNTNRIGFLDERVEHGELATHRFELPREFSDGVYTLSFQLDHFGGLNSSVLVTNVTLGFVGLREPARLELAGVNTNGLPVMKLTAPAPTAFVLEASTNLTDWDAVAWLVNTNGTVWFTDPAATNAARRFYRAVLR